MKKTVYTLLAVVLSISGLRAQDLDQGIKMLNYERVKTARETLKKVYEAAPNNANAIYWYGQSLLAGAAETRDIAAAKAVYQKGLQAMPNDALLIVAMGHIELLEGGDINSAKQKFEQAITATKTRKGENPDILNAIGRANADGSSKQGDPVYGIEKLKRAGELNKTSADIFMNMGVCYQKLGGEQGGEVVKSYEEAGRREPSNAKAFYRIGKIYQSQLNPIFEEFFNKAIAADANFPPVYLEYFEYYANKDVNKAKDYLDKYIGLADKDPLNDFYMADYLFRAGKYQESLSKSKEIENTAGINVVPRLNILYAYNYDRLKDSVQAKNYIEKFFASAPADKITPKDYELAVSVLSKFPGIENITAGYLQKAIDGDTTKANRLVYLKQGADMFGKAKMYGKQIEWLKKYFSLKGSMVEYDYYSITNTAFVAQDFLQTIDFAKSYIGAFPERPQGYSFLMRAARKIDTANSAGMQFEAATKQIEFYIKDTVKNKQQLIDAYYVQLGYYNDALKDYAKALETCDKVLALAPGEPQTMKFREIIQKNLERIQKQQPGNNKPPATQKPAGGSGNPKPQSGPKK